MAGRRAIGYEWGASDKSAAEREFVEQWLGRRRALLAHIALILGIPVHLGIMALVPFVASPLGLPLLWATNGGLAALAAFVLFLKIRYEKSVEVAVATMQTVFALSHIWFLHLAIIYISAEEALLAMTAALGVTSFMIQLAPVRLRTLAVLGGVYVAAGAWAVGPWTTAYAWTIIYGVIVAMTWILRAYLDHTARVTAQQEYRFRSHVAPAHFVRHSIDGDDIYSFFRPSSRFSVCLSSDWRNYQKVAEGMSAEDLSRALNGYYNLCGRILADLLPAGNYYTDWIADELFVVFFEVDNGKRENLIHAALRFGERLIQEKNDFYEQYSVPKAIDVGISAGEAYLGLMGPDGHPKATALGEVPGRSRRLQTAGKLLRSRVGDADRIIFDRSCLMQISAPFEVHPFTLGNDDNLRDLNDRDLFYVEVSSGSGSAVA